MNNNRGTDFAATSSAAALPEEEKQEITKSSSVTRTSSATGGAANNNNNNRHNRGNSSTDYTGLYSDVGFLFEGHQEEQPTRLETLEWDLPDGRNIAVQCRCVVVVG